jgi:hypothetical protein
MLEIKLIDENTDLSGLKSLNWDVNIKGNPYNVYKIDGYVHTIGGRFAENDYWCCPVDETPTYKNLIEFNGEPVRWGIESYSNNYTSSKWGETEVRHNYQIVITRNGKPFVSFGARDLSYGLATAQYKLANYQEHPINFTDRNFKEKLEGRKIWYKNQKAIVEKWVEGQACIIIKFENGKYEPLEYEKEDNIVYLEEDYVKEDILSKHIWWFRD